METNQFSQEKSRRDFLKNAGKTSAVIAVGGLALAGCANDKPRSQSGFATSTHKKKEVLYRSTKNWNSYYASAK
ncbi:hypothetical protein BBW65_03220 [Helicobacter enhydrae]|uniref:Tat pathway signal protein n=1 Tax=Helicobacter enhydrae TaxID=222136 RepID=A0A1B1U529_9HELI|nr:twin-arginine translocation signal domain-containing protein [Helicobacter enhydrae]ANV97873.1 hypothetical protein BBW65_03220 [Helicobacter enhydrae]